MGAKNGCRLLVLWLVLWLTVGCDPVRREGPAVDRSVIPRVLPEVADRAAYEAMARQARHWQAEAAAVNGEWRDLEPLLQSARHAADAGDFRRAVELAEEARFQAEMGYRQMKAQEQVGNPPYLYY